MKIDAPIIILRCSHPDAERFRGGLSVAGEATAVAFEERLKLGRRRRPAPVAYLLDRHFGQADLGMAAALDGREVGHDVG